MILLFQLVCFLPDPGFASWRAHTHTCWAEINYLKVITADCELYIMCSVTHTNAHQPAITVISRNRFSRTHAHTQSHIGASFGFSLRRNSILHLNLCKCILACPYSSNMLLFPWIDLSIVCMFNLMPWQWVGWLWLIFYFLFFLAVNWKFSLWL